jgi:hypothetical protein
MRTAIPLTLLVTALASSLATSPAHARARVFVASYGDDANPCTFGSPCKTFQHAHDAVDAGGEVTAIDSAGFGPISISKSVTISSPDGVEAGIVPAAGGSAITINAGPTDTVVLRGLTLDGSGMAYNGIVFNSGGSLTITNCVVQNFLHNSASGLSGVGILIPPTSGTVNFAIRDTIVVNNDGNGILLFPPNGSGTVNVNGAIDHVTATGNAGDGISLYQFGAGGSVIASVSNSVASNNGARGIEVESGTGGTITVSIDSTNISGNHFSGVAAYAKSQVFLSRSVLTGNVHAYENNTSPNSFFTYSDNRLNNNGAPQGPLLIPATPQ